MNIEFIPYEQALELKELGFDEPCLKTMLDFDITYKSDIKMPLYQQAFRWFREKYNLHHFIERDGYVYYAVCQHYFNKPCKTYEEAELACLIKLIEIVKGGNQ